MNASNVTHDPFVAREESPVGVVRRALFALHLGLEAAQSEAPRSVTVGAGDVVLGRVVVSRRGIALAPRVPRTTATRSLAVELVDWVNRGGEVSPDIIPVMGDPGEHSISCAELFAHACALVEPSPAEDQAAIAYAAPAFSDRAAILLRLRPRHDLLPYPVQARELGDLELRPMLALCHDAACSVLRSPTGPTPRESWAEVRRGAQTFGVLLGTTHIAVIGMSEAELSMPFDASVAPRGEGAPDAR